MLQQMLQQKVQQKLESRGDAPAAHPAAPSPCVERSAGASAAWTGCARGQPELLAEDLRLAMRAIGRITGRVDVEELLDFVFRDFCIGK